ncbi:MAG: hypothetical protein PHE83_04205 [Opitutaceae bacterium]|nr:hypothetical protein [Opitutaceae bacterium]
MKPPLIACLAVAFTASQALGNAADPTPDRGEPYALAGRRLVFTTWKFIRSGSFKWLNRAGQNVTVAGSEGPWDATMERTDQPVGIRLVAQPARRTGELVRPEKPWEAKGVSLTTVLPDGDRLRAWGECTDAEGKKHFCYLESKDGWHWERPEFDFVEYDGQRRNNLLAFSGGTVFKDPSAPSGERYKAVSLEHITVEEFERFRRQRPDSWESHALRQDVGLIFAVRGAVSPDGLRWTLLPEPLVVEHSDTQLVCYFDETLKKYVLYTRNYNMGALAPSAKEIMPWWGGESPGIGRRAVGRSESNDFRRFPVSKVVLETGPDRSPTETFYTNTRTAIPGAPDQSLFFPTVWDSASDSTVIDLAASDDGVNWHFLPGGPLLGTAAFGEWDGGCIFSRPNLVELPDGDWALFYTGYNFPHKYPRGQLRYGGGAALWPQGRLVALEAADRGEFATAVIIPPGRKLRLNALTARSGRILVEVADEKGVPLPGREFSRSVPIVGDQPAARLRWGNEEELGGRPDQPIMLRFRLEQAKIFSLEFTD